MRTRTTTWFEVTVRYVRQSEDGGQKMVSEQYVVDALTFAEAEATITKELQPYITGEFTVKSISQATYAEVFFSDNANDDKWYKAKLMFIVKDEKTAKEKRCAVYHMVQASSFNAAVKNIDEVMGAGCSDYDIANIAETKVMDVFEHNAPLKKQTVDDKPEYEAKEV